MKVNYFLKVSLILIALTSCRRDYAFPFTVLGWPARKVESTQEQVNAPQTQISENDFSVSTSIDVSSVEPMDGYFTSSKTPSIVSTLYAEKETRCLIPTPPQEVISRYFYTPENLKLVRIDDPDSFPRFEVNGYSFENLEVDQAIQNLVQSEGIRVVSTDSLFKKMSAQDLHGELGDIINELADISDVYARYDERENRIYLTRKARFQINPPAGRWGMYALLDAFRGAGILDVNPDWGDNLIYMNITKEQEKLILKLLDLIDRKQELLVLDIQMYKVRPYDHQINWRQIIGMYGFNQVNMDASSTLGKMIITDNQRQYYNIPNLVKPFGDVYPVGEGVAVMPNDWKVQFDIGHCTNLPTPESGFAIDLESQIISKDRVSSLITLKNKKGHMSTFKSIYHTDDTMVVIGIPTSVFNGPNDNSEYFLVMKPRLIYLIKKG